MVNASGKTFLAYNDQAGVYTWGGPKNDRLVPIQPGVVSCGNKCFRYVGQTFAGLSVSNDLGFSWSVVGPIQPVDPDVCSAPPCPLMLRGDPWLATNGTRVLYSNIAHTTRVEITPTSQEPNPHALAVARSENGTEDFASPYVAAYLPNGFVDQPSISMFGDTAIAAFIDATSGTIDLATTDTSGVDARWLPDPPDSLLVLGAHGRPIVHLATSQLAYLAYVDASTNGVDLNYTVFVLRLARVDTGGGPTWTPTIIFRGAGFQGGTVPDSAPGLLGRDWYDIAPMSFDVGANNELHVAFRFDNSIAAGKSNDILYYHCVDGNAAACAWNQKTNALIGWSKLTFSATSTFGNFQPSVAADPNQSAAGIAWYEQGPSGDFTQFGAKVQNGAVIRTEQLRPNSGYFACPTPQINPTTGKHYYGDYTGTLFVSEFPFGPFTPEPIFLTAYARSNICTPENDVTHDQFVQAVGW